MKNSVKTRCKTVYRKAVVYVRTEIEFTDENELQEKIDEASEIDEDDVPDWFVDD